MIGSVCWLFDDVTLHRRVPSKRHLQNVHHRRGDHRPHNNYIAAAAAAAAAGMQVDNQQMKRSASFLYGERRCAFLNVGLHLSLV